RLLHDEAVSHRTERARLIALTIAAFEWDGRGPRSFEKDKAVFETAMFERADGQGHVSIRTLIEDHQADGEVGYLDAPALAPETLGRDLAVVLRTVAEVGAVRRLFPKGLVNYRDRLDRAPSLVFMDRLRDAVDKAARTIPNKAFRSLAATIAREMALVHTGPSAWITRTGDSVALNADSPRFERLRLAHLAGRDVAWPVLVAAVSRVVDRDQVVDFMLVVDAIEA
ncbi:MAG: hypothetical protein ACI9OJ_006081, partial [Myxococcota bacterium]